MNGDSFSNADDDDDAESARLINEAILLQEELSRNESAKRTRPSQEGERQKRGYLLDDVQVSKNRRTMPTLHLELPSIMYPLSENSPCEYCHDSIDYDPDLYRSFGILICRPCKATFPTSFQLLTKTQVKVDYLLTDDDLKFPEPGLPFLLKVNPRMPTWTPMSLFCKYQVVRRAMLKWGVDDETLLQDKIEAEKRAREETQLRIKKKQFEGKLKELRIKTRLDKSLELSKRDHAKGSTSGRSTMPNAGHEHVFGIQAPLSDHLDDNNSSKSQKLSKQVCQICGLAVEVDEF